MLYAVDNCLLHDVEVDVISFCIFVRLPNEQFALYFTGHNGSLSVPLNLLMKLCEWNYADSKE